MKHTKNSHFYITHLIVLIIFIACLMMTGPMRGGLPIDNDIAMRMAYINDNLGLWQIGWLFWMTSALGLLLFFTFLTYRLAPSALRNYGLILVALGIAPDLLAEVIYAFIIPKMNSHGVSLEILSLLEVLSAHLTGFLGNGLYNLGGLLLNIALIRSALVARWVSYSGLLAWPLGLGLSVTIGIDHFKLAELFTASSMVLSTAWMLLIAYTLFRDKA